MRPSPLNTRPAAKGVAGETKGKRTTMTTTTKNRPTHAAYMVEGEGKDAVWTEIGAMWTHEDGEGFNLNLKAIPTSGRLVIRKRKAKAQDSNVKESAGR
jgi:hypothetical protein